MHRPCHGLALTLKLANTRQSINAGALWAIAALGSRDRDNTPMHWRPTTQSHGRESFSLDWTVG